MSDDVPQLRMEWSGIAYQERLKSHYTELSLPVLHNNVDDQVFDEYNHVCV